MNKLAIVLFYFILFSTILFFLYVLFLEVNIFLFNFVKDLLPSTI